MKAVGITNAWCLTILLLAALFTSACSAGIPGSERAPAAVERESIDVCISASSISRVIADYAQKRDLFAKQGLDVNLIDVAGGSSAATALLSGEVDLCQIAGPAVVNADLAGAELRIIGGIVNRSLYSLMVAPDIRSAEDLVGKKVAVSDHGTGSDAVLRFALASLGMDADEDVTIVGVGNSGQRLAALESGSIAGTVVTPPNSGRAKEMGFSILLGPDEIGMPHQHTAIVTSQALLDERRETAVGFVMALSEAIYGMQHDREGTVETIIETMLLDPEKDRAVVEDMYDEVVLHYLNQRLTPTREGVQRHIEAGRSENPNALDLAVDDIIDESILRELQESGFFAQFETAE